MKEKAIHQRIILYRTILTLCWTSVIIIGGGLVGLILDINTVLKILLLLLGGLFEIALFFAVVILIIEINKLIKQLNNI